MKTLPAGLQEHLDTGTTTLAWCWKVSRKDGQVFGFTDHDKTLTFEGVDFEPDSGFSASEIRNSSNLEVDAQDAQGALSSDRITETDILDGLWDNSDVEVWRVNWRQVDQRVIMRRGTIGQIRRGSLAFIGEVKSFAHILSQTVGRTYLHKCDASLGDSRCGVNLNDPSFSSTAVISDILNDRAFIAQDLDGQNSLFDAGTVEWITGANAGRTVEVLTHSSQDEVAVINLLRIPVKPMAIGDQFLIKAGCPKTIDACINTFNNAVNFRGFPDMPPDDYPIRIGSVYSTNTDEPL
jgi:uncharacterized phage protein (TIGR02218 family)